MSHGERASRKHNNRKELGGRFGFGWMSRGWWSKWVTNRRIRRMGKDEVRKQLEEEATQAPTNTEEVDRG